MATYVLMLVAVGVEMMTIVMKKAESKWREGRGEQTEEREDVMVVGWLPLTGSAGDQSLICVYSSIGWC
jgi:hypothetical protein